VPRNTTPSGASIVDGRIKRQHSLSHPMILQEVRLLSAALIVLSVSARAEDKPGQAPEETDPRLHADGKNWRLQKVIVEDPSRPRVLLVGDSILNGYLGGVQKALEGKAYVDAWVTPTSQGDKSLPRQISEVLAQGPYDIIHFNLGLHGWQKGRIPEGQFEPLTHAMVQAFKQNAPRAVLIWASTTPVTKQDHPGELDPEINPIIVEHNAMAAKVMKEEGVPIDDLNSLMVQHLDLARGDRFHWKPEGTALLTKQVSDTLTKALADRQKP
jgi:lysophospholipase L1-like esterase